YVVPGFKLFRAPVRYGAFFALLSAVLAALALSRIERDERPANRARWLHWFWIIAAALFGAAAIAVGPWIDRYTEPGAHATMRFGAARAAILLARAGTILDRWLSGRLAGRRAAPLLVALTVTDLALQWGPYRQTKPPAEAFPPDAI